MQRGLIPASNLCYLYKTIIVMKGEGYDLANDSKPCELTFDTGGWHTMSTRKGINTWLSMYYPNHCIRARIIKRVLNIEVTALDGVVEQYEVIEPITIDLNNVQTKES
jgi:hypothetical protein